MQFKSKFEKKQSFGVARMQKRLPASITYFDSTEYYYLDHKSNQIAMQ